MDDPVDPNQRTAEIERLREELALARQREEALRAERDAV